MNRMKHVTATKTFDLMLLVLRVGIAALMLTHGLPKLMSLSSGGPVAFPPVLGMSPAVSLVLAVGAEVFCSVLILAGLGTRLAVVPLMITMLVAVFYVHNADPFARQELGLLYLLVYAGLLLGGSGRYSIDAIVVRKQKTCTVQRPSAMSHNARPQTS